VHTELQEGKTKANPFDDQSDDLEDEDEASMEPLKTTFELNDTLYAEAELQETDTVFLWLGVRSCPHLSCHFSIPSPKFYLGIFELIILINLLQLRQM